MSFRVKRKETPEEAVQRLTGELIDHALASVRRCDQASALHEVRKDIKKLRAVLRLVRWEIGERTYKAQAVALREAAGCLAATRDAHVVNQALRKLAKHFKGRLAQRDLADLKLVLQARSRDQMRQFRLGNSLEKIERSLKKTATGFRKTAIPGKKAWPAISRGLTWSYANGRKAFQRVREEPSDENFHEWRKRVKDLWYHIRLLRPIWPEQMRAAARQLKLLGELIGDDHDLVLLAGVVRDARIGRAGTRRRQIIQALINLRQSELRQEALCMGARFYVEKPAGFRKRLGAYWKLWRNEPRKRPRNPKVFVQNH